MRRIITLTTLALFFAITFPACEKEEKICDNFAKQGISDKNALIGNWKFESFGYTTNGNTIRKKNKIRKGEMIFSESGVYHFWYGNSYGGNYMILKENEMIFYRGTVTEKGLTKEEKNVEETIRECVFNSICYKIDKEKLYIHTMKIKDNNVLILKKGDKE